MESPCSVVGCGKKVFAKGLCSAHYSRVRRRGSVEARTAADRLRDATDKSGICWIYLGAKDLDGYGQISIGPRGNVTNMRAHRLAWELENGPIPNGMMVCHRCDTPSCVNPAHLFLGTHQDNVDDMVKKGRQALGKKNGKYTKPEKTPRGDSHWRNIEKLKKEK